jgi:hypothetical protein
MLSTGVTYHGSWVDSAGARCFLVVETLPPRVAGKLGSRHRLLGCRPWVDRWDDLIDFEIVPVLTSSDFWAKTT